jgi:RNA polymerase sigma-70 factor (ECF subfamily)
MELAHLSDDELLAATPDRAEAFGIFYVRHERAVIGFFHRRTADAELAADLTAEVFAAALLSVRRYRPGAAPARAWLYGIARHVLLRSQERRRVEDRARRRLGMAPLELSDELLERVDRIASEDRAGEWLDQLSPDQAHAVRAHVIDELSYERIAAELRCSQSVVRKRVSRGLATLRELTKEPR